MKHERKIKPHVENQARRLISSNIYDWINLSNMPSYKARWFMAARDEAFKSTQKPYFLGCVIVYKSHIIGRGHNQIKTHPRQRDYNKLYRPWTEDTNEVQNWHHTLHAEIDAIESIPYSVQQKIDWKKVEVYVYRVSEGLEGNTGLALPCPACANALADKGIRGAYYTTGNLSKPFGYCDL